MTDPDWDQRVSRRALLTAIGTGGLAIGGGFWWLDDADASNGSVGDVPNNDPEQPNNVADGPPDTSLKLDPQSRPAHLGPDETSRMALYDGQYPAPIIRVSKGNVFQASVCNSFSKHTTVHWHGLPIPNRMDGFPRVTQSPIPTEKLYIRVRSGTVRNVHLS